MNVAETARICRAIAEMKPAQKFDDETPSFWALALADVRYEDARDAVITLARSKGFIGTDDIVAEVRKIRSERLATSDRILPDVEPDDVAEWLAARRAGVTALADGLVEAPSAIDTPQDRRVGAAVPVMFRRPPRALPADYGDRPRNLAIEAPRDVSASEAAEQERERERQITALADLPTSDATDHPPTTATPETSGEDDMRSMTSIERRCAQQSTVPDLTARPAACARCGATYLDGHAGHDSHLAVFGHKPGPIASQESA